MKFKPEPKSPITTFITQAQTHWKRIAARLTAQGIAPLPAYEAALAARRSQHHDAAAAQHFDNAFSAIQTELMLEKSTAKQSRRSA